MEGNQLVQNDNCVKGPGEEVVKAPFACVGERLETLHTDYRRQHRSNIFGRLTALSWIIQSLDIT